MPPSMTDYTFAFGDTGTVLNTDSLSFPFIDVTGVSGLDSAPLRVNTDEHQGQDGTYIDSEYMSSRTIVVTGTLYTNPADPDTLLKQLRADYNSNVIRPFYFQLPGQPVRYCNGQGGGLKYDIDTNRRWGSTPVQFTVLVGDSYIYDYPAQQATTTLSTALDLGTSFNASFNMNFGGSETGDTMTVVNEGTHTAYPVITLSGALVNPVLVDNNSGITMSLGIVMNPGDVLVVDCRNKSVILNGTVSRRNVLVGLNWFSVPAGASETVTLTADSGSGTATLSLNGTYY